MDEKSRFVELSTEKIEEIVDNAVPVTTKKATKFGMRLFNCTYQLTFPSKIRNSNFEKFSTVTECLTCPGGTKFSKLIEEISKEELNVCFPASRGLS